MSQTAGGALTPRYYMILGRATEIAQARGSSDVRAEHLFLAIIRDRQTVPTHTLGRLIDLDRVEDAILEIMNSPGYSSSGPPGSEPSGAVEMGGLPVAHAMGDSYVGVEHLFLAIIRDRQTVPARTLGRLIDLDRVEDAILEIMNSPGYRGVPGHTDIDRVFLPEGQELDGPLQRAIIGCLPDGASFGFNRENGRLWIHVTEPGNTRDVLNAALARLGRPGIQ